MQVEGLSLTLLSALIFFLFLSREEPLAGRKKLDIAGYVACSVNVDDQMVNLVFAVNAHLDLRMPSAPILELKCTHHRSDVSKTIKLCVHGRSVTVYGRL